ncbi:EamA family transporter [Paraferrimonas sp. SM1919]|uniref:EamA family transporter n=1 Tax=Paraferrimonas sp. SM1919 TaxID=2662263 RepID=UPI0013D3CD15|nr:EamA family transporter [Paraferrimonas sp. SM1919]
MHYLFFTTALWAFSFSLIGQYLAGQVDAWFAVWLRVVLAAAVFLPFIKPVTKTLGVKLASIGAIQLGLMYCFYYQSFLFLSVPEVLLFTVMTPVYITVLNDILDQQFKPRYLVAALLAVAGAIAIRYNNISDDYLTGLLMVQGANLCFAIGQLSYKRLINQAPTPISQLNAFPWFYLGAIVPTTLGLMAFGDLDKLPSTDLQWGVLIYLGTIASGLGYYLWNKGATLVNTGTLATANNLLIPAGLIVNLVIWDKSSDLVKLSLGGLLIVAAMWIAQGARETRKTKA